MILAIINTTFEKILYSKDLEKWINKVPDVILPVLANQNQNNLELRFSFNDEIENIYFFIDQQDIVLHAKEQNHFKEENNWLLNIETENNPKHNDKLKSIGDQLQSKTISCQFFRPTCHDIYILYEIC